MVNFLNKLLNTDFSEFTVQDFVAMITELFDKLLGLAEDKIGLNDAE